MLIEMDDYRPPTGRYSNSRSRSHVSRSILYRAANVSIVCFGLALDRKGMSRRMVKGDVAERIGFAGEGWVPMYSLLWWTFREPLCGVSDGGTLGMVSYWIRKRTGRLNECLYNEELMVIVDF